MGEPLNHNLHFGYGSVGTANNKTRTIKSNENCSVHGCKSVRKKNNTLMFHQFPPRGQNVGVINEFGLIEIQDRRKLWEIRLRFEKNLSNPKVCSLHFRDDDYECSGWSSTKRLKLTAVPSQNLPVESYDEHCLSVKEKRLRRKRKKSTTACKFKDYAYLRPKLEKLSSSENLLSSRKVSIQTHIAQTFTICDVVTTEKYLNALTGIHTFQILYALEDFLENLIQIDTVINKLSTRERLFLTFMKIKLDIPFSLLSIFFGVSPQTCKRIFSETVFMLAPIISCLIIFPSKEEIVHNMPKIFKRHFRKVRVILDAIVIPVRTSKKLCCLTKCYSHCEGTTLLKFLTGITPDGLISFVSAAYGGRVSDKDIFKRSGLLEVLDKYQDEIMMDKGLLVENLCTNSGIRVVRIPFFNKKRNLSQTEARIASARIRIERTNRRIKSFKMLSNRFPVNLIPCVEYIFKIVCGIVNLQNLCQ